MALSVEPFPTALDRRFLHVFVFGAAVGEAIAVALPQRGWIILDGCKLELNDETVFPALEAYTSLRLDQDDPVELVVWTHPHADHFEGIREAIERHVPRRVGMTLVAAPAPGSARQELEALGTHPSLPHDLRLQDVFKQVRTTIERVFLYWSENPATRVLLSAQTPALELGQTRVRAFSPDEAALRAFYGLGTDGLRAALRARANEYSVVLGLEFGATRVVLGGDLPHRSANGAIVPHAWQRVETASPEVATHSTFKVSHHGSAEAVPPSFVRAEGRQWLVTPFARQQLPRPGDDARGGLRVLLQRVSEVRLTSTVGLVAPASGGETIRREQLNQALTAAQARGLGGGIRPPAAATPFDFSWGVALDHQQSPVRLFAGRQAMTVVETR